MKVLVGMSGGIDSSVAAYLLKKAGYEVEGITMLIWKKDSPYPAPVSANSCYCPDKSKDLESIDRVASILGIKHHVVDCSDVFQRSVLEAFRTGYLEGITPNPCIQCNSIVKFGAMVEYARTITDFDLFATGHYARLAEQQGRFFLRKGADALKDQTYFLWRLTQDNLSRTLFPLGGWTKAEVRQFALARGFEALSRKSESQEICFIPDDDYRAFLAAHVADYGKVCQPGNFVLTDGTVVGRHRGFPNYTIGQRKGLGIALGQPMFVLAIRPEDNTVVLGTKEQLQGQSFYATRVNAMKYASFPDGMEVVAKIRYRNEGGVASLHPEGGRVRVDFHTPVNSITPGQSVVFYEGDDVVGGGVIE